MSKLKRNKRNELYCKVVWQKTKKGWGWNCKHRRQSGVFADSGCIDNVLILQQVKDKETAQNLSSHII